MPPERVERPPAGERASSDAVAWHAIAVKETLRRLESHDEGLRPAEVAARLGRYGPNRLRAGKPVSALRILVAQFSSLVVLLLAAAAVVALFLGDTLEATAIGAVLAVNSLIGFVVELRARRAMDALLRYEVPTARVVREGRKEKIGSDGLVPGDVVELEEGDRVPADARLLSSAELRTNEAPLTGESLPVQKQATAEVAEDAYLAERATMVYAGTHVLVGRARGVVVDTGARTEIGRIGTLVSQLHEEKTPLEVRLDALGRRLVWLTLLVAAVVTALGALQGAEFTRVLETGIALAIAAVPEGLPVVATIALAVGLRRMARRNAMVRRLASVEALGGTTVVCTDKTGTLTAGEMTAQVLYGGGRTIRVTGTGYAGDGELLDDGRPVDPSGDAWLSALVEAAALTSRATLDEDHGVVGDPTDAALTVLARKAGVDAADLRQRMPQVDEIPFSSERRSSASIHRHDRERVMLVKGAPESVLGSCTRQVRRDGEVPLETMEREAIAKENEKLAARGLRVIALARGMESRPDELGFLGLVGIVDPPAAGVKETIGVFRRAGIRTVMITGDQTATARAIARELGALEEGARAVDGREIRTLSDAALADRDRQVGVFSRVGPEDKLRIVTALQESGEIVAMLGDGVNDAAALKKADVGVAMGMRGTDVAKQAADIVLADDRFVTVGAAVEEGRVIFENIRRFVFYLFSCNLAEVLVLLVASLATLPLPLLPLQILWLNLVTDTFPALALAMEPAEPGVMDRPPRDPEKEILSSGFIKAIAWYAGLITAVTLAGYVWGLRTGDPARAVTLAFMTLALAQLFHLGNARSHDAVLSLRGATANPWALGAVPLVIALQVLAVTWPPLMTVLRTVSLSLTDWAVVLVLSGLPAVVGQVMRLVRGRSSDRSSNRSAEESP